MKIVELELELELVKQAELELELKLDIKIDLVRSPGAIPKLKYIKRFVEAEESHSSTGLPCKMVLICRKIDVGRFENTQEVQ